MSVITYLEGDTDKIETVSVAEIREIHERYGCVFFDRNVQLKDIMEEVKKQLGYHVGEHKVIIHSNAVVIGCRSFTKTFLKSIIILQEGGCRIGAGIMSGGMRIELIADAQECIKEGIYITDSGFVYDKYFVTVEEVRKWVS